MKETNTYITEMIRIAYSYDGVANRTFSKVPIIRIGTLIIDLVAISINPSKLIFCYLPAQDPFQSLAQLMWHCVDPSCD